MRAKKHQGVYNRDVYRDVERRLQDDLQGQAEARGGEQDNP